MSSGGHAEALPMAGGTGQLDELYTGSLHDALKELDLQAQVLPRDIVPLAPGPPLSGPAFVIEGRLDPSVSEDAVLLQWTILLDEIPQGSVLICQPNDNTYAHMGELSALTLLRKGVRGYIVDGGTRDCDAVRELGFPVWSRYRTPMAGPWLCQPAETISIGTASVANGDYVRADGDGVVVVPAHSTASVIAMADRVAEDEALVRQALAAGQRAPQVYRNYGRF